jgi:hypothetical protein
MRLLRYIPLQQHLTLFIIFKKRVFQSSQFQLLLPAVDGTSLKPDCSNGTPLYKTLSDNLSRPICRQNQVSHCKTI